MSVGGIAVALIIVGALAYIVWKAVKVAKGDSPCSSCGESPKQDKGCGENCGCCGSRKK